DTTARQGGQYLTRTFEKIGLPVDIEYLDGPTYFDKIKSKGAQLFASGWVGDYPDAENFLMLFITRNISPLPNSFNYSNPKFDELFDKAVVMQDSPERTKLYEQLE